MDPREGTKAVLAACRRLSEGESCRLRVDVEKKQREWIWEYVLKHCTDQRIIEELMKVYQIPNDNLVLKRMLLLRTLSYQVTEPLLPDAALDVLRGLIELAKPGTLPAAWMVALPRNSPIKRRRELESEEGGRIAKREKSVVDGYHQHPGVPGATAARAEEGGFGGKIKGPDIEAGAGGAALDDQVSGRETGADCPLNSRRAPAEDAQKKRVLPSSLSKGFRKIRDATRSSFLNEETCRKGKEKFFRLFPKPLGMDAENGEKERGVDVGAQAGASSDDRGKASTLQDCTLCYVQTYQPPDRELLLAVMTELSVQYLRSEPMDLQRYREAIQKHWGASVEDTEDQDQDDSGVFQVVKTALWAALEMPDLRNKIVKEHKREDMEKILTAFLHQAWSEIGPTFLGRIVGVEELSSQDVPTENMQNGARVGPEVPSRTDEDEAGGVQVVQGLGEDQRRQANAGRRHSGVQMHNSESRFGPTFPGRLVGSEEELSRLGVPIENMNDGGRVGPEVVTGNSEDEAGGVQVVQDMREDQRRQAHDEQGNSHVQMHNVEKLVETGCLEAQRAIQNLRESEIQLYRMVKDPLPQALMLANQVGGQVEACQNREQPEATRGAITLNNDRLNLQPSVELIEEDISESPEQSIPPRVVLQRPASNKFTPLVTSPFDSPPRMQVRRRMRKKWTEVEETTLKLNVQKYGKGRWKFILKNNMDVFTTRTEVDLKDKWRNIEKAEGVLT